MSRWGKRKAPATEAKEDDEAASDNGITAWELSKNRKVVVREWKGQILVDIREFYTKDGQVLPTRKGISLTLEQWEMLRKHADEVDSALEEV